MKNRFNTIYYYIMSLKYQKISSLENRHISLAGSREKFHILWWQISKCHCRHMVLNNIKDPLHSS